MSAGYLNAAKAVLLRTNKPMHYDTITRLAVALGLLETSSRTPDIGMSTALSRASRETHSSGINKVRRGVYELVSAKYITSDTAEYEHLGARVHDLVSRLEAANDVQVVRRAFFFLRQCLSLSTPTGGIDLGDGIKEVHINLMDISTIKSERDRLVKTPSFSRGTFRMEPRSTFRMDRQLRLGGEGLRSTLRLQCLNEVVDLAVSVIEIASRLHSDGLVIASGSSRSALLHVIR